MTLLSNFELSSLSYIGVFVGALLIYDGLWQLLSRSDTQKTARNRRMKLIAAGASPQDVLNLLKPDAARWPLMGVPLFSRLPQALRQAGVAAEPTAVSAGCIAGALVTGLMASAVLAAPVAAAAAICLWIIVPLTILNAMRRKRMDRFGRQLPEALDLMSRGLRVGHPLNVTIASVAEEMADPIASEFGIIVDQVAYGDTLVDAVIDLAERVETEDVRYLASSIAIQHGTGGDLAAMLATLSRVMRDRMNLRRKVHSITAEGRLSAIFLSAIPFLMVGLMSIVAPEYYSDVADDPAFMPMAATVLALVGVNALVLRRLVKFHV